MLRGELSERYGERKNVEVLSTMEFAEGGRGRRGETREDEGETQERLRRDSGDENSKCGVFR